MFEKAKVADFVGRRIRIIVACGLAASWVGLLGDLWWFLDLFAHFRLQYLACCVIALPWFWLRKSRVGIAVAAASLLLNVVLILRPIVGSTEVHAAPDFHLRAVSINVRSSNHEAGKVMEFIRQSDADVVFLMEVDEWWAKALIPLKEMYFHSLIEDREDNFGVAFFSRVENTQSRIETFGDAVVPTVVADLRHAGKDIRFVGTHPLPPTGSENSELRNGQLQELQEFVGKSEQPVLLVGDVNATPWSVGMRILKRDNKLRLPAPVFQWSPTWLARSPLAVSIDHALASSPLAVLRRDVGPDVGSDHRPIIVDVGWTQ